MVGERGFEPPTPLGGGNYRSGCPEEKQFHHQLQNQGNTLRPGRGIAVLSSVWHRCAGDSNQTPKPSTSPVVDTGSVHLFRFRDEANVALPSPGRSIDGG